VKPNEACPCGSGDAYTRCCGRFHAGAPAPTPEALMRSRYSAYALQRHDYLLQTWHPTTRPADLGDPDQARTKWIGLQVRRAQTLPADAQGRECGLVAFVARYRVGSRGYRLEECSRFVREDGRWFYLAGEVSTEG